MRGTSAYLSVLEIMYYTEKFDHMRGRGRLRGRERENVSEHIFKINALEYGK